MLARASLIAFATLAIVPSPSPTSASPHGAGASARVASISPSAESVMYVRVAIELQTPASRRCRFDGYRLIWPGGSVAVGLDGLRLPRGTKRLRTLRVEPADGDVDRLTTKTARVEVDAVCDP